MTKLDLAPIVAALHGKPECERLYAALTRECRGTECRKTSGKVMWTGLPYLPQWDSQYIDHPDCSGTGRVPIDLPDADGALEGIVRWHLPVGIVLYPVIFSVKKYHTLIDAGVDVHRGEGATVNAAVLAALAKWRGLEVKP